MSRISNLPKRNDPCHCGSGRKYKKCHWKEDQRKAAERAALEKARLERLKAMGYPTESDMRGLYEEMTGRTAPQGPIAAEAREMITELWQQRRLVTESRKVIEAEQEQWAAYFEEHPTEFDAIAIEQAKNPFFDRLMLKNENIQKVLSNLGALPDDEAEWGNYASEAMALTLDGDDRSTFNDAILSFLPDLVYEGKMRQAYVAFTCAIQVLDTFAPITPFQKDMIIRSMQSKEARRLQQLGSRE